MAHVSVGLYNLLSRTCNNLAPFCENGLIHDYIPEFMLREEDTWKQL